MKKKYWRVMSVALTIVVVFGVIGMIGMSKEKQGNIQLITYLQTNQCISLGRR